MRGMRIALYFFAVVLFGALPIAAVQAAGAADKTCIPGTEKKKTFSFLEGGTAKIKEGLKGEAQSLVSRNDKCSDEKITIDSGMNTTVTLCVTRKCDKKDTKYGCAKGQKAPQLLFGDSSKGYITINKCHKNNEILNAIASTVENESPDALIALASKVPALRPLTDTTAGTALLSKVLSGQFDATNPAERQEAIDTLVSAGMPNSSAIDAINRIAQGDAQGAQKLVQDVLKINPETYEKIASLAGANPSAAVREIIAQAGLFGGSNATGFGGDGALTAEALRPDAGQMKIGSIPAGVAEGYVGTTYFTPELSHFNDAMCANGPCDNSTPGIAHRSWPLGSVVEVCNRENGICANAVVMDRGPSERLVNRTIDANPALRSALQMSGGLVPATYTLLSVPGSSVAAAPVGSDVSVAGGAKIPTGASPFSGITSTEIGRLASLGGGSPFANLTPAPSNYFPQSSPPPSYTTPVSASQVQTQTSAPVSSTGVNTSSSIARQLLDAMQTTQTAAPKVPPVATIVAQPLSVVRGNPVTVSWSSVGMSAITPCVVRLNETVLGTKNAGTKHVATTASTARGTMTFRLQCITLGGQTVQKSVSVTVR